MCKIEQSLKALWYKCKTCGTHFRAVTDMDLVSVHRMCSKETNMRDNGEYFEALPQPLEPTDFFEHKIKSPLKRTTI
jgi:hypothetical protein